MNTKLLYHEKKKFGVKQESRCILKNSKSPGGTGAPSGGSACCSGGVIDCEIEDLDCQNTMVGLT